MINGKQLVDYAKAQIGRPYWYGTFGQIATEKLLAEKAAQYPKQYSATRQKKAKDRGDIGQKVHDCIGLYKGALWSEGPDAPAKYNPAQDISADGAFKKATQKGPIGSIPEIMGLGVYRKGHVGIYIGGGRVVQAKGFDYGVIESDTEGFTDWFMYPEIDYTDCELVTPQPEIPEPAPAPEQPQKNITEIAAEIRRGDWGNEPERTQRLTAAGYSADFIKEAQQIVNETIAQEKQQEKPIWIGIVNTVKDPLNVRSGRGKNYPVVKQLAKGSMAELTGDAQDGWIQLADGSGYVSAAYIVK